MRCNSRFNSNSAAGCAPVPWRGRHGTSQSFYNLLYQTDADWSHLLQAAWSKDSCSYPQSSHESGLKIRGLLVKPPFSQGVKPNICIDAGAHAEYNNSYQTLITVYDTPREVQGLHIWMGLYDTKTGPFLLFVEIHHQLWAGQLFVTVPSGPGLLVRDGCHCILTCRMQPMAPEKTGAEKSGRSLKSLPMGWNKTGRCVEWHYHPPAMIIRGLKNWG